MGEAKKKQWRGCPAAGREIAGQECGEGRHGQYACPAGCGFDPFAPANYSQVLKLEEQLDLETFEALLREDAGAGAAIRAQAKVAEGMGVHAATVWRMFFQRDASGRTFAERWAGAGKLKNDGRVLWRGKAATRASVFEVGRIIDHERFEVTDLLAPGRPRMLVIDRSMGARVARFQTFVTWAYPLPHYWRFNGSGMEVLRHGPHAPETVLREVIRHLGGPTEDPGRWLAENFVRVSAALEAVAHARRRRMLEAIDARFGTATYELTVPVKKALAVLATEPAIDRDELSEEERKSGLEVALVWFAEEAPAEGKTGVGRPVMGRVLLGKRVAKVEAMGGARLDRLREQFEARMGTTVKFSKERRDDLGRRMAAAEPRVDEMLVPPRLLDEVEEIVLQSSRIAPTEAGSAAEAQEKFLEDHQRRWLDTALRGLDGRTPREAAGDLRLRGRVIELVKQQLLALDRENLRTGGTRDIGWMVRELGLAEIDVPPPGKRPRMDLERTEAEEMGREEKAQGGIEALPLGRPLTAEEAVARLEAGIGRFATASAAMAELETLGVTLLDDVDALTEPFLTADERAFLVTQLLQVWFALVPAGEAPVVRGEAMRAAVLADLERLRALKVEDEAAVMAAVISSRQPQLAGLVATGMTELVGGLPKKLRPRQHALGIMAVVLTVVIDEVDRGLRP